MTTLWAFTIVCLKLFGMPVLAQIIVVLISYFMQQQYVISSQI